MNNFVDFKKIAKSLKGPFDIQQLMYDIDYCNQETMQSAQSVWESGKGHCLEVVHLAAALMEAKGFPPLILSLDSADNICHVVYTFKGSEGWGSLGRSRELGLHGRAPKFRTLRELAWSYFDPYVDDTGKLIGYALADFRLLRADWRFSRKNVWASERFVLGQKHIQLSASRARYSQALKTYKAGGHQPQKFWW